MGLSNKLKDWFVEWAEYIAKPFDYALAWGIERAAKRVIPNSFTYFESVIKMIESSPGSPSLAELVESGKLAELLKFPSDGEHHSVPSIAEATLIDTLATIGAIIGSPLWLLPFLTTIYEAGWSPLLQQQVMKVVHPALLNTSEAIKSFFLGETTLEELHNELARQGYSGEKVDDIITTMRPLLAPDALRQLELRKEPEFAGVQADLEKAGWTPARIAALKKLYWLIPGVQDLIRMAVREAFSPDIVAKYQTDADFPPEFATWAAKQGLSAEWAKNYWRAHWDLPSATQGFEMLHRGVISPEDLNTLLRTLDVMPYWRDRLVQIAYSPFTRVDVRRMHAMGILTRDQVKQAYKDLGFDDAKAEAMTEFTIQYNAGADKDLNKTDILSLYNKGVLTDVDAKERLMDLDYSEEDADYLIAVENTHAAAAAHELSLTQIKDLALAGIIDKTSATARLAELGYTAEDIINLYSLWELEAQPQDAKPSRTDLARFYEAGIITLDEWIDGMYALRYTEEAISWYYLDMTKSS